MCHRGPISFLERPRAFPGGVFAGSVCSAAGTITGTITGGRGMLVLQINGFWLGQKTLLGSRILSETPKRGSWQKKTVLQNDSTGNPLLQSVSVYFVALSLLIHGGLRRKEEKGSSAVPVLREELPTISWDSKAAALARGRMHSPSLPWV